MYDDKSSFTILELHKRSLSVYSVELTHQKSAENLFQNNNEKSKNPSVILNNTGRPWIYKGLWSGHCMFKWGKSILRYYRKC